MGRALKGRRDEAVIATKFGARIDDGRPGGARPEYIRTALEASLSRLATNRIDLYQLHSPDPDTPIADTLGTLGELVEAGKIIEIGCSNFSVEQIRQAEAARCSPAAPVSSASRTSTAFSSGKTSWTCSQSASGRVLPTCRTFRCTTACSQASTGAAQTT